MYFPEEEADLDFQTPSRQNDGPPIRPSTLSNVPPSARLFPTSSALLSQSEKRGSIRRSPTEMRVSGREIREMLGQVSPTNGLMRGPEDTSDDFVVRRAPPSEYRQIYQARFASRFFPSSFPLPSLFFPPSFPLPSLSYHGLLRRIKWQERRKRLKTACSWFCFFLTVSAYVAFLSMLMVNLVMSVYYGLSDSRTRCISTLCVVVLLCCRERLRHGQRRPDANDQPRL